MQDANIAKKIVSLLYIEANDRVLEIGPGPGALTRHIVKADPLSLLLLEKDSFYAAERSVELEAQQFSFRDDFDAFTTAFTSSERRCVLEADAMNAPWSLLSVGCKIIGNLPYNVASPLMWDIFSAGNGLKRAVFMVQREVGLRLVAQPATAAYGALSIFIQSFVRPKLEFIVPPQVFFPAPKVHSAVLSFEPLEGEARSFCKKTLAVLVKQSFQQRRKQLGTIFKNNITILNSFEKNKIDFKLRPEALTPEQFQNVASDIFLFESIDNQTDIVS